MFGFGQLLKKLSEEISILEDILRCGEDSMADSRNGLDENEEADSDIDNQSSKSSTESTEENDNPTPLEKLLSSLTTALEEIGKSKS